LRVLPLSILLLAFLMTACSNQASVKPLLIDESAFEGVHLQWVRLINQDAAAINEQDAQTYAALRDRDADPSLLPTFVIESVAFVEVDEATDETGGVFVDWRFLESPTEPQYTRYSFQKKEDSWIITDVTTHESYKPRPSESITPRYMDESNFTGDQLEWIRLINQDVKAIADGDEATFHSLRSSQQQANFPALPIVSVEFSESIEQSSNKAIIQVDRRAWGSEAEPQIRIYVLVKEDNHWLIADVD
jgi:hypothetical protein